MTRTVAGLALLMTSSLYQETLARSLTDKYVMLSGQMDKLIHDANAEIHNMREKMKSILTWRHLAHTH